MLKNVAKISDIREAPRVRELSFELPLSGFQLPNLPSICRVHGEEARKQ